MRRDIMSCQKGKWGCLILFSAAKGVYMNAFFAVIPIILIRYGLMALINKDALPRANFYAPLHKNEKPAYYIYVLTNTASLLYMFFLSIDAGSGLFPVGLFVYCLGIVLYGVSAANYAQPKTNGINTNGLYKISRNPMYVSYFIIMVGCVLLTRSLVLLALSLVFQVSAHFIILSEERWCAGKFKDEYTEYMKSVRRYF